MSPRQLRLHETTDGCDKGNKTGPFALAPGGLVAAPAAGLRGDNTGSSTSDFIGLDGSGPTKKRTGGPLEPGDGETTEHGGSGKKQASAAAAASLALASAGQEMELLMHTHGDLEDKCEELQRKLDEVGKERDELQAKNAGQLSFKRGASCKLGMALVRLKREGAVLTVADDSTWDSSLSTGREAKRLAFTRALAGVMYASSTLHPDGSCTASPTKLRAVLERLQSDIYWPNVLTEAQAEAEDLSVVLCSTHSHSRTGERRGG